MPNTTRGRRIIVVVGSLNAWRKERSIKYTAHDSRCNEAALMCGPIRSLLLSNIDEVTKLDDVSVHVGTVDTLGKPEARLKTRKSTSLR
jgi:hypothetical protein